MVETTTQRGAAVTGEPMVVTAPPIPLLPLRRQNLWRDCLGLFCLALLVRAAAAWVVSHPGYIDAYYYQHIAHNILRGRGAVEDVAWNYLVHPVQLPQAGGAYWPPGTSLFVAAGAGLLGGASSDRDLAWRRAQSAPVLASALLVPGAYLLSRHLRGGVGARRRGLTVAGLVLLSGVYFPYWVTTDTFTPFALLGGSVLWLSARSVEAARKGRTLFLAGALAGLAQGVRPDGALLVVAPLAAWLVGSARRGSDLAAIGDRDLTSGPFREPLGSRKGSRLRREAVLLGTVVAGLVIGLGPWLGRNWATWGAPVPPGATAALWLTEYDELFAFGFQPGPARWLDAGVPAALGARGGALAANLGVLSQPLLYYLVPAFGYGCWRLRRERRLWPVATYLGCLYLVMSLVFPFQGTRGGLFHSTVATLPFLLLATVVGIEAGVRAAARRRGWRQPQAQHVFAGALLAFALLTSAYFSILLWQRWDSHLARYASVADWLASHAVPSSRIMVADPPGFWYASGRSATVIPSDGFESLVAAAAQLDVAYVLVEPTAPRYLASLLEGSPPPPPLEYAETVDGIRIYRILHARAAGAGGRLSAFRVEGGRREGG